MSSIAIAPVTPLEEYILSMAGRQERGFGDTWHGGEHVWYKFGSHSEMEQEQTGYALLSRYYPVAHLRTRLYLDEARSALVFDFLDNARLLADATHNVKAATNAFAAISSTIAQVYNETFSVRTEGASSNWFFADRIQSRFEQFYADEFLQAYSGAYAVNGRRYFLDLQELKREVVDFFTHPRVLPCVIGQCDLNDRNITEDGVVLDYLAGGYNPLMAEFATFYVYQMFLGPVLAPLRQAAIYRGTAQDNYTAAGKVVSYSPGAAREALIHMFYTEVIEKVEDMRNYSDALRHFKMYAAMRFLGIFNISECEPRVRTLTCALLARVNAATSFEELLEVSA